MTERAEFEFGGGSIAEDYDDALVPLMFDPWAELLIEAMQPESTPRAALSRSPALPDRRIRS